MISVPAVYLLHGKGGSPNGTVAKLEECLHAAWPDLRYIRPALPHGDPAVPAEMSVEFLRKLQLEAGSLIIGVSLGGLVAAKLQEDSRPDLHVICVSSPVWADGVSLENRIPNRVALYSSSDDVIAGRIERWPFLAKAFQLASLTHDTDQHLQMLTNAIGFYLRSELEARKQELM